ncbi:MULTISPECIES: urease accessory protein UreE [Bartonella]|uniref:urease accessory protein UreE n=1 Tax=Bartonella TaxID=773 RepID=UPI0018DC6457|nr:MULTISPECIES: urease accessory protein UreE [Bartonella]MBH9976311.1 urease accessory protein UreE [Bartonella choladocola]MBI0015825.1 urease accessory protein UreE [Bartonella sp. B10834G3]
MSYKTFRATKYIPVSDAKGVETSGALSLSHDERHIRRKLLHFANGDMIMVDLKEPVHLKEGDVLEAENGEYFLIHAANEPLYSVKAATPLELTRLAWHLGNRHQAVEIKENTIFVSRDPVIRAMLEGLGATIEEIEAPFQPLHGAYHDHAGHHH